MLNLVPARVLAYLGGALIALLVVTWGIWRVVSWKHAAERLPQVERELADVQDEYFQINAAIQQQERKLRESRQATDLLSESLKNEIHKNAVYTQCIIPAEFMRLRNEAIRARHAK